MGTSNISLTLTTSFINLKDGKELSDFLSRSPERLTDVEKYGLDINPHSCASGHLYFGDVA
jgi:hypothetical protein